VCGPAALARANSTPATTPTGLNAAVAAATGEAARGTINTVNLARPLPPVSQVSSQGIARWLTVSATSLPLRKPASDLDILVARQKFGLAFHAYWQSNYEAAARLLREALESDEGEARCWYYLGFCERALGRGGAAEAALARAVRLHAAMPAQDARTVSKSIERVQGELRMELEAALLQARLMPKPAGPATEMRVADAVH